MELERLIATAQSELERHTEEAVRLQAVADELINSMEWHTRQASRWHSYIGQLSLGLEKDLPAPRALTLVETQP